jgi:glycine/D-amino acid oxidase-like deaminating enzyme
VPIDRIVVVGAGLAGSLLALAVARRGLAVTLAGPPVGATAGGVGAAEDPLAPAAATGLSYAGMLGCGPARRWRRLEARHGPLGWRRSALVLHGWPPPLDGAPLALQALLTRPLPFSRIDVVTLNERLPQVLAQAGVERLPQPVRGLAAAAAGWRLHLSGGEELAAEQVVLAAGAGCRGLWPDLPRRLRHSWAGILLLERNPGGNVWLEQARRGRIVQPRAWRRPALERQAEETREERWIVDAGVAPWGEGVLLGQISRIGPEPLAWPPPGAGRMEGLLRQGLAQLDPELGRIEAVYRQVPVTFCSDGRPLVEPVQGRPGLWAFTGFSGAFAAVPLWAERLAERLVQNRNSLLPSSSPAGTAAAAEGQSASQ